MGRGQIKKDLYPLPFTPSNCRRLLLTAYPLLGERSAFGLNCIRCRLHIRVAQTRLLGLRSVRESLSRSGKAEDGYHTESTGTESDLARRGLGHLRKPPI